MTFSSDLDLALAIADLADSIALERFRALDLKVETKPDRSPVTDADQAVERAIKALLAEKAPSDALIGEEYGSADGTTNRTWIIDPIDGTANYLRGVPVWATLIALAIDGKPTVSVVSAPAMGRRWWAAPEIGAWTRDIDGSTRQLAVSGISDFENASISYNNLQLWDQSGRLPQLLELSRKLWRTRAYGDFWSYMLLAEGALEIVAEHDLKIYDIAALVPIVELAGGQFSDLDGSLNAASSSVLATNGKLHFATAEALRA
ncbi:MULTISPECIES: inositol monophosphatase family protein [Rhodoluna]|uniref:inositol monophosphatase family protein n=1 Tax=Rhodoluna TaxID=529883 RepID=UPI0011074402|nr:MULTISPECIES: inositol monophosphatase family protein [Rhodoluna]BDS49321.1 histidinol-phosphatase [Rhodoluna sp. KAS3]